MRGEVVHPAVSSVLYLSGAGRADPTVVLDQRVGDCEGRGARLAHVSHPVEDAVLMFPGDRLHCVCPSPPPPQPATDGGGAGGAGGAKRKRGAAAAAAPAASGGGGGGSGGELRAAAGLPQRVTLMIGFWARDVASVVKRPPLGACAAVPRPSRKCTWPKLLAPSGGGGGGGPAPTPRRLPVHRVPDPWEALPAARAARDPWAGRLAVPEARNHRFFVRTMAEFRRQLVPQQGQDDD